MAKLGNRIIILANGQPIAGTKVNDIETAVEVMERCSPTSGQWKKYVTKRKSWKFSAGYLVVDESAIGSGSGIQDLLKIGQEFQIIVHDFEATHDAGVIGTAILTRSKMNASIGKLVEGNFEFQGSGPLEPIVLVDEIALSKSQINMEQGVSIENPVSATVTPGNATNKVLVWSSSDTSVATVTQDGNNYTLHAVAGGACELIASATDGSGVSASCNVLVSLE